MKFDNLIVLGEGNTVYAIEESHRVNKAVTIDSNVIDSFKLNIYIMGMVHPVTYINKLIVYDE